MQHEDLEGEERKIIIVAHFYFYTQPNVGHGVKLYACVFVIIT